MIYVIVNPVFSRFVLVVMACCTILFPLLTISILRSNKSISSVHMPTKEERRWPLLFGTFFFVIAHVLIKFATEKVSGTDGVNNVAISGIATLMVCTIINMFYKLSIHMAGIGGLLGVLAACAPLAQTEMIYFLIAGTLGSGLVGFSRLYLKAHSAGQVIVGFIVGFTIQFLLLSYLSPEVVKLI